MNIPTFIKGFIIGAAMAAPVGPISILCIRRSLAGGYRSGLATALGVAFADGFYAMVAAFGISAISNFLLDKKEYLYIVGGLMLIFLGYKAFTAPEIKVAQPIRTQGFLTTLIQTMLLTLTNPMTIISFVGLFAAIGFQGQEHEWTDSLQISLGVFTGSAAWFMGLSTLIVHVRKRVTPAILAFINKVSGILLMGFGTIFVLHALKTLIVYFTTCPCSCLW